jgi:hypothetical protein
MSKVAVALAKLLKVKAFSFILFPSRLITDMFLLCFGMVGSVGVVTLCKSANKIFNNKKAAQNWAALILI